MAIPIREADIAGARGQPVVNPSVAEICQARVALSKLLGALELPESTRDAVRSARKAAEARRRQAS